MIEEQAPKGKQSETLQGNTNAKRGEHSGRVIRLSVADTDLLYDFFASEGNSNPSSIDFVNAMHYALVQTYGRKLEDQQSLIC